MIKSIIIYFNLIFLFVSCKSLNIKKATLSGEIKITSSNVPVNAKLVLLNKKLEIISIIDSTHYGKYNFSLKNNQDNSLYLVISDIKGITEKNNFAPDGLIKCNNKLDTITISISSNTTIKNIHIKECESDYEIHETNHHR